MEMPTSNHSRNHRQTHLLKEEDRSKIGDVHKDINIAHLPGSHKITIFV